MQLRSLVIFFLILHFPAMAQVDTLPQSEKHGKWIYFGKERPDSIKLNELGDYTNMNEAYSGYHIEYRLDSTIYSEGQFENGKKIGLWIFYYEDGKSLKRRSTLKNDRPDGLFEIYWRNGHIKKSGIFSRSKYIGKYTRYFESGCVYYEAVYDDAGNENGPVKFYYDCDSINVEAKGQIEFEYTAKSGIPIGKAFRYSKNGGIIEFFIYGDGGKIISRGFKEDNMINNHNTH